MMKRNLLRLFCVTCLLISFIIPSEAKIAAAEAKQPVKVEGYMTDTCFNGNFFVTNNNKYALYSPDGTMLKDFIYDRVIVDLGVMDGKDQLIFVSIDGKWGAIDENGNERIPAKYDYLIGTACYHGYIPYKVNNKWGLLKTNGDVLLAPQYDSISDKSYLLENKFIVEKDGLYGIVDINGNTIVEPQFNDITPYIECITDELHTFTDYKDAYANNLVVVQKNGKCGIYDMKEKKLTVGIKYDINSEAMAPVYFKASEKAGTVITISKNGKYGLIDLNDKVILEPKYDKIWSFPFAKGTAAMRVNNKYGIIDKSGKVLVKPQYDFVYFDTYTGNAIVEIDNKCGIIDRNGKFIVKPQYEIMSYNSNGTNLVAKDGKAGLLDKSGKLIVKLQYQSIVEYESEDNPIPNLPYLFVMQNSKWGVITKSGKLIINTQYYEINYYDSNSFVVSKDGMSGIIDSSGKYIYPLRKGTIINTPPIGSKSPYLESIKYASYPLYNFLEGFDKSDDSIVIWNRSSVMVYDIKGKILFGISGDFKDVSYYNGVLYCKGLDSVHVCRVK